MVVDAICTACHADESTRDHLLGCGTQPARHHNRNHNHQTNPTIHLANLSGL
jgi:hypothetical protein